MASAKITVKSWGTYEGKEVKKFTLKNTKNQEIDVVTFGATITAIRIPDKNNVVQDIVLGFDNVEGYYRTKEKPYFGATIGRLANRLASASFTLDDVSYNVSRNVGNNSLHGGEIGWSHRLWHAEIHENERVVMTLLSEDGDQGYPGAVLASAAFQLDDTGKLNITMRATCAKSTIVNIVNHSYFNLAGHASGATELYEHRVAVYADRYTPTDADSIPSGVLEPVAGSRMDLRQLTRLGERIDAPNAGYDDNYAVNQADDRRAASDAELRRAARLEHPGTGLRLDVFSNQPGVQVYTSNLPTGDGILGKNGAKYRRHGAICFETQNYPDAIHHANFPSPVLRPGELYCHEQVLQFGLIQ